jgi:hypothetical protein
MPKRRIVMSADDLPDEFILTVKDVAAILACDAKKAGDMLATGRIPGMFRFGIATFESTRATCKNTAARSRRLSVSRKKRAVITCINGLEDEFILTVADIAASVDVSADKVNKMMRRGDGPGAFRFCERDWRISAGDLRKYNESQKIGYHRLEGIWPAELIEMETRRRRKLA